MCADERSFDKMLVIPRTFFLLPLSVTLVIAMTITGTPTAEDRIQMQTLMILALAGVRKSRALTGWQTAM